MEDTRYYRCAKEEYDEGVHHGSVPSAKKDRNVVITRSGIADKRERQECGDNKE